MRKIALLLAAAFVPLAALALDYTDISARYTDAPFPLPERAGISALTKIGAVQGHPSGAFLASTPLNRAEFLKIAQLTAAAAQSRDFPGSQSFPINCFPDVRDNMWFHQYVCLGKRDGVVQGYPQDGLFHPERFVNTAEAVKMLAELFEYDLSDFQGGEWYMPYMRAAQAKGVLVQGLGAGQTIRRGEMARLAAGFYAESKGELDAYRQAERGAWTAQSSHSGGASSMTSSSSSAMSMSMQSTSASSLMSGQSSSPSSVTTLPIFPARSHLLMVGERSQPIASLSITASTESVAVRSATVRMRAEYQSLDAMFLIDSVGHQIGTLSLDPSDTSDKTWKGTFTSTGYTIPHRVERTVGIVVRLKARGSGGISSELVQVDSIDFTVQGLDSFAEYTSTSSGLTFPQHQTTQAQITSVTNAGETQAAFLTGNGLVLGAFRVEGRSATGARLRLTSLDFEIAKSQGVAVSGWQLGTADSTQRIDCSVSETVLSCLNLPEEMGTISGSRVLRVYGNVSQDAGTTNPSLQLTLNAPGSIGVSGAIRWTDGSGNFTWVELPSPIARGTLWRF